MPSQRHAQFYVNSYLQCVEWASIFSNTQDDHDKFVRWATNDNALGWCRSFSFPRTQLRREFPALAALCAPDKPWLLAPLALEFVVPDAEFVLWVVDFASGFFFWLLWAWFAPPVLLLLPLFVFVPILTDFALNTLPNKEGRVIYNPHIYD